MLVASLSPISYEKLNINRRNEKIMNQTSYNEAPEKENIATGYYLPFKSKWITKMEQKALVDKLENCKQGKPESMQKVYDIGKDFINRKISKAEYLKTMDIALLNVNELGDYTNEIEKGFTMDFLIRAYDDNSPENIKKDNIIKSLIYLSKQ